MSSPSTPKAPARHSIALSSRPLENSIRPLSSLAGIEEGLQLGGGFAAQARHLGEAAIVQDDLLNSESAAQENYLLYVKKQEEARMADALDQRGIVNVAVAQEPVAPALPLWSTWAVLAIGIAAAGTAGTGAAFVTDRLDAAFRTPDDVLLYLNAPVLASLPSGLTDDLDGRLPA